MEQLPTALSQVKTGNTSENLLHKVRQILKIIKKYITA